ncbi:PTS glucose transporter subunit IIA [Erysipelotrichaceae bacterium RD49]|nr:PTS glucose transporter subunit IIA [Erysipelotrichaceae bacterium RD49]
MAQNVNYSVIEWPSSSLHIGIDTVSLGGKGFKVLVEQNQQVTKGTPLIDFDIKTIQEASLDPTVMVISTASPDGSLPLDLEESVLVGA